MTAEVAPTIHELYPGLDQEQAAKAEENLEHYLDLILRIFGHLESNPVRYPQASTLTEKTGTLSCTPPRSNPATNPQSL